MADSRLDQYLSAIQHAKSDNQIFATLLMIAKVTKEDNCDINVKTKILKAINPKFFSRLLKTKNVPEGCPETIFKSVAISVLSALCEGTDSASFPVFTRNIDIFNDIIASDPSESALEERQLVEDGYQCLHSLCDSDAGRTQLLSSGIMSVLSQIIINHSYGHDKAADLMVGLLHSCGSTAWQGCRTECQELITAMSQEFKEDKSTQKFELCKTLVVLLETLPEQLVKKTTTKPEWFKPLCAGLDEILRNKTGPTLQEPALRLGSLIINIFGLECLLPPSQSDSRLFLLISHFSFVEVRMILEEQTDKVLDKSGQLLACYSVMENVLNFLANCGDGDDSLTQVTLQQLHSAMMGAWGAVIYFLQVVRDSDTKQYDSITMATVRVLAAWIAEETTALKDEVQDLLPFLLDVGQQSLSESDEKPEDSCIMGNVGQREVTVITDDQSNCENMDAESSDSMEPCKGSSVNAEGGHHVTFSDQSEAENSGMEVSESTSSAKRSTAVSESSHQIDVFRFLLPGLCHLTADDTPRLKLLDNGLLDLLETYFHKVWGQFQRDLLNKDIQSGLVLVCNVYLNLVVTEHGLVQENNTFCNVLKLLVSGIPSLDGDVEHLSLWLHFGTLGMLLFRSLHHKADKYVTTEEQVCFFKSVIRSLMESHVSKKKKGTLTFAVSNLYSDLWEEIGQTWFLRIQALCECIPLCKPLCIAIEQSGWVPHMCRLLLKVKGNGIDEETSSCMIQFLICVSRCQKSFRAVVSENNGQDIARIYKSAELGTVLKTS